MTTQANMNKAIIVADEALEFMAKKAGISRKEIVKAIDDGHEATCKYFAQLCAIGMLEAVKQA